MPSSVVVTISQRPGRAAPEEKLERRCRRELRGPPESAVDRIEPCRNHPLRLVQQRRRQRLGRRLDPGRPADSFDEPPRLGADVLVLLTPRVGDGDQELRERRQPVARLGWEIGPGIERLSLRRQEDGHRPPALTRHRDGRLHVERVDIRTLLPIDLDIDEVVVHQGSGCRALERLVRHHVAPVTGAVAHREQDRPILPPRPLERLRPPRVPVDRVVGVLEEIRARLGGQPVHRRATVQSGTTSDFFERRFRIHSIRNATLNAIPSPSSTPFHGCSSNCLPPTYPSNVAYVAQSPAATTS